MLKLVPFNQGWLSAVGDSGTPLLDIKAIYRRPRVADAALEVVARDEAGFIEWDLTTGLPMFGVNHNKWLARGFHYVTLADRASLVAVSKPELAEKGVRPLDDWADYVQEPRTRGPWNAQLYLEDLKAERAREISELIDDIQAYGPERAERLRQVQSAVGVAGDLHYRLPEAFTARVLAEAPGTEPPKRRGRPPKAVAEALA